MCNVTANSAQFQYQESQKTDSSSIERLMSPQIITRKESRRIKHVPIANRS